MKYQIAAPMSATTPMIHTRSRPVGLACVACASAGPMAKNKMTMTLNTVTNDLARMVSSSAGTLSGAIS